MHIFGNFLPPNVTILEATVEFTGSDDSITTVVGTISNEFAHAIVIIPTNLSIGVYNVRIFGVDCFDALTIFDGEAPEVTATSVLSPPPASNFQELIGLAFTYSIYLVGILVFIMIMWGGFLWITSSARPENIANAKKHIYNAIIGAILLLSIYVILYTLNPELVGGTFNLTGIQAPPPTGDDGPDLASQAAAKRLITEIGIGSFSVGATCGDPYHARQTIQNVAEGLLPPVCSISCASGCVLGGPSGDVNLSPFLLDGLVSLSQYDISFIVTSLTTGSHALNSLHYSGRAADIDLISTDPDVWIDAVNFLRARGINAFCESRDGSRNDFCNLSVVDHIHLSR